jgi:hypothetical protein
MHTFIYTMGFLFLTVGVIQQWRLSRIEKKIEDDKKKLEQDKKAFSFDVVALEVLKVMRRWHEIQPLIPKDAAVSFEAKLVRRKYDESENVLRLDIGDVGRFEARTTEELLYRAALLLNADTDAKAVAVEKESSD